MYSETLLDHFEHPRNVGALDHADAVGEGENPVCGDRMHLELQIRRGVIEAVGWRAEGCVPCIAAASVASELLRGVSIEQADALDRDALSKALGGVPPRKAHAPALVITTLKQALREYARVTSS